MNDRTAKLRRQSLDTPPHISVERAVLLTEFYQANAGLYSVPVMRSQSFLHLCRHKTIYLGAGELIVGERGPEPKAVPTFPELTCHSVEDLKILNSRAKTWYRADDEAIRLYREKVIPYWRGRSLRDRIFAALPPEWIAAYDAGMFTEFMEQRAPGHTVLDDKIYHKGMLDFKRDIAAAVARLDFLNDPLALDQRETLQSFDLACDAVMVFAERHAALAREQAARESDPQRRAELNRIAEVCTRVPANAPENFYEALQYYWFCHLAVITELNGWDSFNPGHLDQHLLPFYEQGLADGSLTRESARELLECFFIKFNNHPAPPKVGVTAAESGTYTDFANINIGGLLRNGADGANEISHLLLDIVEDMHLLQPSTNIQLSRKSPDHFLKHALRVVGKGYGFPSIFNTDAVVQEQLRQGKSLEDARSGGCSGCVEIGAFGKEAYILTGYFNMPKCLELALHNGVDPLTGKQLGPRTGSLESFRTFEDVFAAYQAQFRHFLEIKLKGNQLIGRIYATAMPAPFLSVLTDDCVARGRDYNSGGARYNNTYVQFVGLGTVTDSFSALRQTSFEPDGAKLPLGEFVAAMDKNFNGQDVLRQRLLHRTRKYGNDDDYADDLMVRVFNTCFEALDGRPESNRGGRYRIEMLPTTCHVYFGSITGATPDGRSARRPVSEGVSPVQGADRHGPTAVIRSAAKMDHLKAGGTLLNMKFAPDLVATEDGLDKWLHLVRSYFKMDGHHIQFNVVRAETLREAQQHPEQHRDLIVRVAGYSDYFCDLSAELQEEIITRTEHETFQSAAR
jgi:pyruvate formate-lyase/glycerol dehydratase family glycyl radical enzyme